jgi:hypothetical protein
VQDALYNVTGRLRDNLFSSTQNNLGTRSSSSVLTDTSPYGRLRDPPPLGSHPSVGVSHGLSRHTTFTQSTDPSVAVSHSLSRHTINPSIDNLGISHGFDRPPSPRFWPLQVISIDLSLSLSLSLSLLILPLLMDVFDCSQQLE